MRQRETSRLFGRWETTTTPTTTQKMMSLIEQMEMQCILSSGSLIPIAVDGDVLMEVQGQGSDAVLIDCAEGTIQNNGGTNLYGATIFYTSYHDFPTIPPGAHTITATGATALLVLPRWYVL